MAFADLDLGTKTNGDPATWSYYTYSCRNTDNGFGPGECLSDSSYCTEGEWNPNGSACGSGSLGTSCGCCVPRDPAWTAAPTPTPDNDHGIADGGGEHGWDYCDKKELTDAEPAGTFSPANFEEHLAYVSPVSGGGVPVLYDLNVLSATEEQIIEQLEFLKAEETAGRIQPVLYLEFGNEFFISSHYEDYFPTADSYMEKIASSLVRAKELFPNAKRAVPANMQVSASARACKGPRSEACPKQTLPSLTLP